MLPHSKHCKAIEIHVLVQCLISTRGYHICVHVHLTVAPSLLHYHANHSVHTLGSLMTVSQMLSCKELLIALPSTVGRKGLVTTFALLP